MGMGEINRNANIPFIYREENGWMDGWFKCTWIAMHVDGWMDGIKRLHLKAKGKSRLYMLNAAFKI
jgi:hypothetical protein